MNPDNPSFRTDKCAECGKSLPPLSDEDERKYKGWKQVCEKCGEAHIEDAEREMFGEVRHWK